LQFLLVMSLFNVPVAVIFAREILEASVIIGQFRNVVLLQGWDESRERRSLRIIWLSALAAASVALLMIVILAVGLAVAGNKLDKAACEIIEGISKIVASFCIAGLSLKIPKWLGIYTSKKEKQVGMTDRTLIFNVSWNIWREIAEIGAFLIPSFLSSTGLASIPLSGISGLLIGLFCGGLIYFINRRLQDKTHLALFMAVLTAVLSSGLMAGGCHELEEVLGETPKVWKITAAFWDKKKLPMALFKPFGWTSSPTVLWIVCLVVWDILLSVAHFMKYRQAQQNQIAAQESTEVSVPKVVGAPEKIEVVVTDREQ